MKLPLAQVPVECLDFISITDENGNDRTAIVDQGIHYSDLDSLALDIANALGLGPYEIELVEV